ncbi:hypothetical protein, conserved [Eimeria brunetti]|uniref:Uncharacterized protein n=1 Tax=Eimeria brunetti TaxID=51314 RepID=U6L9P8_9EIME|nr:hypothetical protein, conserved [Eimeria brunetti]
MAYRDVAVAGVPSERLSQLASPQLAQRPRRENAFGTLHSAFHDEMSAILRPCNNSSKEESPRQLEAAAPVGYAGKTTAQLNSSRFTHGSKKQSAAANTSGQIACLFSGRSGSPQVHPRGGTRPLKQYIAPDQLPEAFCTKFQVTDPFTGRTEIMTARRPGKAAAEINLASFDSYMLPRERTFSLQKAKDNIDHSILVRIEK